MITFDLECSQGHTFEGWFEDSQAYEEQRRKELIACPACNDTAVFRVPSTFAIKSSTGSASASPRQTALANLKKKFVDYVEKNFDDVGPDFTKEALKIHYGVTEPRNIRGVSTDEEEKTMNSEGISFIKIPMPQTTKTES